MLAERVEGNLLAAHQEIEKLLLLHGTGSIDAEQYLNQVDITFPIKARADSPRVLE